MSPRRAAAVVLRQYYLMSSSPARIPPLFIWVAIDIVLWGFITRYLNTISAAGFNFVPALLGAVLLWDFFVRILHGVTMAFFEDVWSRNFLNFFASPLTIGEYLLGLVVTSIGSSVLGLAVMLLLAVGVFGLSMATYGAMVLPFLLVLFLFGTAMGIFGCGVVLRLGPAAEWFIWPIPAILSPFAGVFYPISTLPKWMQWIGRLLPPSYVFEGLRAIVRGEHARLATLAWGAILAGVYISLAYWFFTGVYRRAVRTGLIARYSAESLN
jgi:ABC-2 type transport system permease protein